MKIFEIAFFCCLFFLGKCQLYSGFLSPFPKNLFPPSTSEVQKVPYKFVAVERQPIFKPCQHPTFPTFSSPYNTQPLSNPCPTIDVYSSVLQNSPIFKEKSYMNRITNHKQSTTSTERIQTTTTQPTTSTTQPESSTTTQSTETTTTKRKTTAEKIVEHKSASISRKYAEIFESSNLSFYHLTKMS